MASTTTPTRAWGTKPMCAECPSTVLARDLLDRLLGLPSEDWNGRFHRLHDPIDAAVAQGKTTTAQDRVPNAPASHDLQAYEGVFHADGYPDLAVRLQEDGSLQACTLGSLDWSMLRHYHYDVFEWHLALWDTWIKARFLMDERGELNAVSVPLAFGVPEIVFHRKSVGVEPAVLAALAGDYRSDVQGVVFHVAHRDGKLYWSADREPPVEAVARKASDAMMEFSLGHLKIVFTRADGQWNDVQLKASGATFGARRAPPGAAAGG